MTAFDLAPDIKIYNFKTHEVFKEKGMIVFDPNTNKIVAFGNECSKFSEDDPNYIFCVPIILGKITDFTACEKLIRYFYDKYIKHVNGKRQVFTRSKKILFFLHELINSIDLRVYSDVAGFITFKHED